MKTYERVPPPTWAAAFKDFSETMNEFQGRHDGQQLVLNDLAIMFAHYFALTNFRFWGDSPNKVAEMREYSEVVGAKVVEAMKAIIETAVTMERPN